MERLVDEVRRELEAPSLNPDSQADLLRTLRKAGIQTSTTSRWELEEHDHPAIPPLLAYKKLARLLSANGGHGSTSGSRDGRFRPDYVPGGVATGRWATAGGGALQLPKDSGAPWPPTPGGASSSPTRPSSSPECSPRCRRRGDGRCRSRPRPLPRHRRRGCRRDARAGEVAILGAMYGATTGECGRCATPARAYPRATALVDRAAAERRTRGSGDHPRSAAARPRRRPSGAPHKRARASPRRPPPTNDGPARSHATGVGSPATSSCRAARPSGPCAGWPRTDCAIGPRWPAQRPPGAGPAQPASRLLPARRDHRAHAGGLAVQAEQAVREAALTATRLMFGTFDRPRPRPGHGHQLRRDQSLPQIRPRSSMPRTRSVAGGTGSIISWSTRLVN